MANINVLPDIFYVSDHHFYHGKILWLGKGRPFGPPGMRAVADELEIAEDDLLIAKDLKADDRIKVLEQTVADLSHTLKSMEAIGIPEMNEAMIERHNSVVKKGSRVYDLGDWCLKCTLEQAMAIRKRLNGQCFFVEGNHDAIAKEMAKQGAWIWSRKYERIDVAIPPDVYGPQQVKHKIMLCHYAQLTWHGSNKGVWQLYGHSHGQLEAWKDRDLPNLLSFDVGVDCWNYYPVSHEQVIDKMRPKVAAWKRWRGELNEGDMEF